MCYYGSVDSWAAVLPPCIGNRHLAHAGRFLLPEGEARHGAAGPRLKFRVFRGMRVIAIAVFVSDPALLVVDNNL